MIKGVYGINIAVKDLDASTRRFEALLGVEAVAVSSSFFAFPGLVGSQFNMNGFHLNLIASLNDDTSVAKFIEKRGEGFFLLSLEVDGIGDEVRRLRNLDAAILLENSAEGEFGAVNFVHPKSFAGVQVELLQPAGNTAAAGGTSP